MSFKLHIEQTVCKSGGEISSSQLVVEFETEEQADIAFNAIKHNETNVLTHNVTTFKTALRLY